MLPASKRRRKSLLSAELTPMIDVIFLLLIYFFMTTTQTPPESELAPALQAQRVQGGGAADFQPQVVDVVVEGGAPAYRIGARTVRSREALDAVLAELPQEGGLFVRGAGDAPTGWAVGAIQSARDAGFLAVTYVPGEDAAGVTP
ncbi:MAG: biopolymer transporter ExbD [Planctomycetota bacterium]